VTAGTTSVGEKAAVAVSAERINSTSDIENGSRRSRKNTTSGRKKTAGALTGGMEIEEKVIGERQIDAAHGLKKEIDAL